MLIIVLPAYNEEADLPPLREEIRPTVDANGYEYRVLVVKDGSRDATVEVARRFGAEMPGSGRSSPGRTTPARPDSRGAVPAHADPCLFAPIHPCGGPVLAVPCVSL